ncbi:MAG TPA: hypothetical protein VJ112_04350 [Rhabdochlamydiaceae bacterium]|nr:hypothetical protein [Rhabdochlamydiaceae bacterium]
MSKTAAILHSPFSPQMMIEEHHRSLLLQFILNDIFQMHSALAAKNFECLCSSAPTFFPFDWTYPICPLQKTREHMLLLQQAFPTAKKKFLKFEKVLKKTLSLLENPKKQEVSCYLMSLLKQLFCSIEPFIENCKENENLIYFLIKNRLKIDQLMENQHLHSFLNRIFPQGLKCLSKKMSDLYYERGFQTVIPQIKALIAELEESHECL